MSCKCAKYDCDEGWKCSVSGDRCIFLIPNSKSCAEQYGEGPDVDKYKCIDDIDENLKCPVCGTELKYQENGGLAGEDFEEWIECSKCDYSRDLNNGDIERIYGGRD